mmetsp:Transcript_11914/g.21804  ORF Transcript_11914/g.21804 Transcript_11914/m.21804 type:complete len:327 (+) Transcript_11914:37-1017(+)
MMRLRAAGCKRERQLLAERHGFRERPNTAAEQHHAMREALADALLRLGPLSIADDTAALTIAKTDPEPRAADSQASDTCSKPSVEEQVEELLLRLKENKRDAEWGVRLKTVNELGKLGTAACKACPEEVAPSLAAAMHDRCASVRQAAHEALMGMGPLAAKQLLAAATVGETVHERRQAVQAINNMGVSHTAANVEGLVALFREDARREVRHAAAEALCTLGPAAPSHVAPALEQWRAQVSSSPRRLQPRQGPLRSAHLSIPAGAAVSHRDSNLPATSYPGMRTRSASPRGLARPPWPLGPLAAAPCGEREHKGEGKRTTLQTRAS